MNKNFIPQTASPDTTMAVSQRQIAEKLGVSIALVSRVLSGKAAEIGITQETIQRVLTAANEMGYVPSAAALGLIGKSTRTIGIAVYDFNDPFFGTLIQEIQTQAHAHDYTLVLAGFLNRQPDQQDVRAFHKHTLDGLIVIGTDPDARWLKEFDSLPIARIGHGGPEENSVRITIDETGSARSLLRHLSGAGHRKPFFIGADLPAHSIRANAVQEADRQLGLAVETRTAPVRGAFQAGQMLTEKLLQMGSGMDSLLCATDRVAMGALHAMARAGVTMPVTGFDDIPAAAEFIPPITTIRQPVKRMVEEAFAVVLGDASPGSSSLPGELMVRQSA